MFAHVFAPKTPVEDSVKDKIISDVLSRLVPARPWRAIVFGSYATGTANEDSDIDVLIVCRTEEDIRRVREKIYSNLSGPMTSVPVDFVFVSKSEFERKKNMGGVCFMAHNEGVIIFESE
jgi:predicted nucleotidyltransferase